MIYLKEIRRLNNITQEELSKRLAVAQPTVANWESGRREPSIKQLIKLSKILNCTIDLIVKGE